jgi:hypothetical protein
MLLVLLLHFLKRKKGIKKKKVFKVFLMGRVGSTRYDLVILNGSYRVTRLFSCHNRVRPDYPFS